MVQIITVLAYTSTVLGMLLLAYLLVLIGSAKLKELDGFMRQQLRGFVLSRTLRHLQRQAVDRHR